MSNTVADYSFIIPHLAAQIENKGHRDFSIHFFFFFLLITNKAFQTLAMCLFGWLVFCHLNCKRSLKDCITFLFAFTPIVRTPVWRKAVLVAIAISWVWGRLGSFPYTFFFFFSAIALTANVFTQISKNASCQCFIGSSVWPISIKVHNWTNHCTWFLLGWENTYPKVGAKKFLKISVIITISPTFLRNMKQFLCSLSTSVVPITPWFGDERATRCPCDPLSGSNRFWENTKV